MLVTAFQASTSVESKSCIFSSGDTRMHACTRIESSQEINTRSKCVVNDNVLYVSDKLVGYIVSVGETEQNSI